MRGNRDDDPFDDIFREIERMMEEMMGFESDVESGFTSNVGGEGGSDTHVDVHEYDNRITVVADLPGVEKDDIELQCDGRLLSISATTETRRYDERVRLPARVDEHSAEAKYNNGVLEVTFECVDGSADISVE